MREMVDLPHRVRCWAGEGRVVGTVDDHRPDITNSPCRMLRVSVDGTVHRVLESEATPLVG